tara:strand:+ start:14904 stop:15476 length:573 start_codon:yes stop_codon:yes gene_type:complete
MIDYYKIRSRLLLPLLFFINLCCVDGIDYEQTEPITITPTLEVSLVYTSLVASDFLDDLDAEVPFLTDSVVLEAISDDFINDYLVRADFNIEITNSLNKDFEIQLDLIDSTTSLQYSSSFYIENSPSNTPITIEQFEVFSGPNLEALKVSNKLDLKISPISSPTASVLTNASLGSIVFKSTVVLYFEISK